MATTIDSLQIEIQSSSTSAANGIRNLSKALGELKSNGKQTTAIHTLQKLRTELANFSGIDAGRLNLASMVTVVQGVISALQPLIRLLSDTISQAMEWDGIEYQFGNAFGEQADLYYEKITQITDDLSINKQTFMGNSAMSASMLVGFGVDAEDARKMGVGYTELAYDIWAAYNNVYKSLEGADGAMAAVRSAIAGEVEPIRRAGFTIVDSQLAITAANHGIEYSTQNATEEMKSYLRYLTLVEQATSKGIVGTFASEMNTAEGMMRTFSQQLKSLAQTFGSLFIPVLVKVMPYVQAFVELLTEAVHRVADFFGITIQKVDFSDYYKGVGGIGESANEAADAVGGTTKALKELKNATLGIDELNIISPPDPSTGKGSGGSAGASGFEGMDVDTLWDQSVFDKIQFSVDEIKGKIEEALSGITAVVSGFMLAIGTILVVSGANIPLGLGMMAVGAVGLATTIAENWDSMSQPMRTAIGTLEAIVGGALLTFGAILALTGANIPLGIGMIAAGAISLVSAVALNWNALNGDLKTSISKITAIVSGALIGIGAVLALTGVATPLGIAMIAAGAVGIVATASINWNSITTKIKNVLKEIGIAVGGALLALGAVLALTGVALPIGIGLMAAGAASLAAGVSLNWNSIKTKIQSVIKGIGDWLKKYGLLALGVILCLTGAGIPLGIALIKTGLNQKTEKGNTVGNELLTTIKSKWNDIKKWWNSKPALKKVSVAVDNFKTKVVSAWNTAKTWWNTKKGNLAKYTPSIGSIRDRLSSAWSSAKTWWNKKKSALAKYTPTIGSIRDRLSSAWSSAKSWWNKKSAMSKYTPTIGSIKDRLVSAWNTAKTWWNRNVKLSIPSLSFKVTYSTGNLGFVKNAIVKALDLPGWPKLSFAANGGIFDAGSLIWAGERGPEVVANAAGGKTGVMNVEQMSEAVYEGVYAAVVAAMSSTGGNRNQAVNVYLDGKQITSTVEKRQRERGMTLMGSQVYSY